jgi:hypothetical protein
MKWAMVAGADVSLKKREQANACINGVQMLVVDELPFSADCQQQGQAAIDRCVKIVAGLLA